MSRAPGLTLLSAAAGTALLAACGGDPPAPVPATVRAAAGQTFACRDSFPTDLTSCPPAAVGGTVVVGGGVHTAGGGATLRMETASTNFRLLENSSLRYVANNGAAVSFLLTAGRVFADHAPGSGDVLIQSGNTAVAALGTRFTVAASANGVIVSVDQGEVAVAVPPQARQAHVVHAGEGILVPPGASAPPAARPMSASERQLWQHIGPGLQIRP
ncbi:MAG TPA: FecR family protein [Chloroflexia bacterium]|nr:FecR family protein [Chloroflexia bacterium]